MNLAVLVQMVRADTPVMYPGSRGDLARTFAALGFTVGAEVGVWKGEFSEVLCKANPELKLTCVDPWSPQPDYREDKNNVDILERAYQEARARLSPYPCAFIRRPSSEAAGHVADGALDFVYIDGNHRYDAVTADIEAWAPKVRRGGIVAGHDFFMKPKKHIEVEKAVRDYAERNRIEPWFVLKSQEDVTPSWFWVAR